MRSRFLQLIRHAGRLGLLAALPLLAPSAGGQAIVTITAFGAGQWGASDATLGITGYVIEDFEDNSLAAGFKVGWETPAGNVVPGVAIPFTFDPVQQDPNGTAFHLGVWDGSRVLVNTRTNQSYVYNAVANWGDIVLMFTTPVSSVGFSLQQNDFDVGLSVNGTSVGGLQSLTGLTPDGGRYGYIRIDATAGNTISTIQLANGRFGFNDGFVLDRLAFAPVPEPAAAALLAVGVVLLAARRRRR